MSLVRGKLFACLALGLLQMNNVILLGLLGRVGVLVADYLLQHLHLLTVLVHYVRFLLHEVRLRLLTNNNRLLELLRLLSAVALLKLLVGLLGRLWVFRWCCLLLLLLLKLCQLRLDLPSHVQIGGLDTLVVQALARRLFLIQANISLRLLLLLNELWLLSAHVDAADWGFIGTTNLLLSRVLLTR